MVKAASCAPKRMALKVSAVLKVAEDAEDAVSKEDLCKVRKGLNTKRRDVHGGGQEQVGSNIVVIGCLVK